MTAMGPGGAGDPSKLSLPWTEPPARGTLTEVAPGLLWFRLPLPYRLDHVNIYLVQDRDGWAAIDTGLGTAECRAVWEELMSGPLAGQRLTKLVVTHFHPDHVGLAGWLSDRYGAKLLMPRSEYLYTIALQHAPGDRGSELYRQFYRLHGLPEPVIDEVLSNGHAYLRQTTGVPSVFHRLEHGRELRIGSRVFQIMTGGGHAIEQAMLYCAQERLFLSADQVIARISPNIGVYAMEPEADALGAYLRSLREVMDDVPADVLVLPGHGLPFQGLHHRIEALIAHHLDRCAVVRQGCLREARSAAELIPVMFSRPLDPHQTGFAFVEVLAHVNYMLARGELRAESTETGVQRYRAVPGSR